MLFHDDPGWVREMISFWEDYLAALLKRVLQCVVPDLICISEDMAYKRFPMISPAMTREFLLPTYQRWGRMILEAGCPLFAIDSDGFVGDLIPVWIEGGVNVCMPMEVAAGNDLLDSRRRFGKAMAFQGGVDKRIIARGGEDLEAHLDHLESVIQDGGYIPSCDHAVPADVCWPDYLHYVRVLAGKTGWL
jgi:uroporphyrinogen decarboxylase